MRALVFAMLLLCQSLVGQQLPVVVPGYPICNYHGRQFQIYVADEPVPGGLMEISLYGLPNEGPGVLANWGAAFIGPNFEQFLPSAQIPPAPYCGLYVAEPTYIVPIPLFLDGQPRTEPIALWPALPSTAGIVIYIQVIGFNRPGMFGGGYLMSDTLRVPLDY